MNQKYKDNLVNQIKETYGKTTYSYTTYLKRMNNLKKRYNHIKWVQILLSAISAVGFVGTLFEEKYVAFFGAVISVLLLSINTYFKDFKLNEEISLCERASDDLWLVREEYLSLLTDAEELSNDQIIEKRDCLIKRLSNIYKKYPKTDRKSYRQAQKALKSEEEQFFSQEELNWILLKHLRSSDK